MPESGPAIELQKMPILAKKKNHLFEMMLILILSGVCKEAKLSHLGHRKSARIEKPTHNTTLFGAKFDSEA